MAATTSFHHHRHHNLRRRQNLFDLPFLRQPNSLQLKAQNMNWVLKTSLNEGRQSQGQDLKLNGLVDFLYNDLQHIFDERGIDPSIYDDRVRFRDPITKFDTIGGHLFNIWLLKFFFDPKFLLHSVSEVIFFLHYRTYLVLLLVSISFVSFCVRDSETGYIC